METRVDGLVIGETKLGDTKKYIRILTSEYGTVSVIVYGANSAKNKNSSAVKPFSFSSFVLTKKGEGYTLKEASLKKSFFALGNDPKRFALASYMLTVAEHVSSESDDGDKLLSLVLNALFLLCETDKPLDIIKAAFELKTACVIGFMPSLIACSGCSCEISDSVFFKIYDGNLICEACSEKKPQLDYEVTYKLSLSTLAAMRYVAYSPIKKVFSFSLEKSDMKLLCEVCEKYILSRIETNIPALKIYKTL